MQSRQRMTLLLFTVNVLALLFVPSMNMAIAAPATSPVVVTTKISGMPLAFTENCGQWNQSVQFRAEMPGMILWFTKDGVTYQSIRHFPINDPPVTVPMFPKVRNIGGAEQLVLRSTFEGTNPGPAVTGEEQMDYTCNYFLGNDPAKWQTDVPNFARIVYHDLYPGIDLAFYGSNGTIEYDFIVHPDGDPGSIAVRYENMNSVRTDREGNLVVATPWGELRHRLPRVWERYAEGSRLATTGNFCVSEDGVVRFDGTRRHEQALALIIDPALEYSTYLGGGVDDYGFGIAVKGHGTTYVAGYSYSTDFPLASPFQADSVSVDAFISKLSGSGTMLYSTYLGGKDGDWCYGLAVDGSGNAFITGTTQSTDFPTHNPYQTDQPGEDAFVAKLNSTGNALVYGTYLGGDSADVAFGIAVDGNGNACVTGRTFSSNFPTRNPYQTRQAGYDAFVTKLNTTGDSLAYSTYLGGMLSDAGVAIATDEVGNTYVAGQTASTDFPTVGAYQSDQADLDGFVTKLSGTGGVVYSTYLGGGDVDWTSAIAVAKGKAYVTGGTSSSNFPAIGAYQTYQGTTGYLDAFVSCLSTSGSDLVYSTYLGGSAVDEGLGIAVDGDGNAYVAGHTNSPNFPLLDSYQRAGGGRDAFVTKLNPAGNGVVYSTLLGGSSQDVGGSIAVDAGGFAYLTGNTSSADFPAVNAYQTTSGGAIDAFVVKLGATIVSVFEPQSAVPPPASALLQNTPNPFNGSTTIQFCLKTGGAVELAIYNLLGEVVGTHREAYLQPGSYSYEWSATTNAGRDLPSGVYLYRLTTPHFTESRKMTLLK